MIRRLHFLWLIPVALAVWAGAARQRPRANLAVDRPAVERQFREGVLPVLREHCWDCHGDSESKGGVNFDRHTNLVAVLGDRGTWERVLQTVRSGEMPPK
ncbi:MAG: c-type cytochrome domain-containing protein, partial [Verrucomicrobiota bacterium]